MPANLENSAVATGLEKVSFHFIPKERKNQRVPWTARRFNQSILKEISPEYLLEGKKGNTKECSNYHTIVLISHASKVMLKILQVRLQQYVNCEVPDV